jgi:L-2-hydroxyglutarate oxidase LhgO
MEAVDILVIGAGVIGLAIAERLADGRREIAVVERHDGFGRETSSRNSEVIHGGLYYHEDLLKTRLCTQGNPMLYELCARAGIPHRKTGKIVVATSEPEAAQVQAILEQGRKNGVPGLRLLSAKEIRDLEPRVSGLLGLYSPESGIVDSHQLMAHLERGAQARGATVAYNCEVVGLRRGAGRWTVEIRDADEALMDLQSEVVINSAGLQADRIAALAGIDVEPAGYRIHLCKGEYFKVSGRHRGKLSRLAYPTPSAVHLGAHAVLGLDGGLKIGPNSFFVETIDYNVDPAHQRELHEQAHRFLPFLEYGDLSPDMSGIRPKLYRTGEPMRDFVIREEADRGLPGLIDLIGMESPGLTACLAIAEMVEGLL